MLGINYIAVVIAALAAFLAGAVWNSALFGDMIMKLHDPGWEPGAGDDAIPPPRKLLLEFSRSFVVALVLAWFIMQIGITSWTGALQLGFLVWIGFPAVMLCGAVMWEKMPIKLAAIHAGDWIIKLWLMAVILSIWQ